MKSLLIGAVFLAGLFGAPRAIAGVEHYDVQVDGLSCPFCVRGLKKKLGALKGVKMVKVDLKKGVSSFDVESGAGLPVGDVEAAVIDAGFSPKEYRVKVRGHVARTQNLLQIDFGGGLRMPLASGAALPQVVELINGGNDELLVTGVALREKARWVLRVDGVVAKLPGHP